MTAFSDRRYRRRVFQRAAAVLVCGVVALAGCSNGDTVAQKRPHTGTATASPVDGVEQVTITTGNDLRFHPASFVVTSGQKVRVVLRNTAAVGTGPMHNLVLSSLGDGTQYAAAGQTVSTEFVAPAPGRYQFVCQLHVEQGQTGTMIVRAA